MAVAMSFWPCDCQYCSLIKEWYFDKVVKVFYFYVDWLLYVEWECGSHTTILLWLCDCQCWDQEVVKCFIFMCGLIVAVAMSF